MKIRDLSELQTALANFMLQIHKHESIIYSEEDITKIFTWCLEDTGCDGLFKEEILDRVKPTWI